MIRRAGPGDAEAIARIFRESRAEAMPWLPVLHDPGDVLQHFRGRVETDEVFVLEREGGVAGFAILNGDELDHFYVAPEHQRAGVGAALFRHVQEHRPERFGFWVFRENERARRFYRVPRRAAPLRHRRRDQRGADAGRPLRVAAASDADDPGRGGHGARPVMIVSQLDKSTGRRGERPCRGSR